MSTQFFPDGLPYEDAASVRTAITPLWKRLFAEYVERTFNGGLYALNRLTCKFLEKNSSARVLDVGTGNGELLLWWAKFIGSQHLYAMDAVKNVHANIQTSLVSLDHAWPFEADFFDVVMSSQNIEHIIDTPLYLEEACRVLKPGGYMIILTENLASWANMGALFFGWLPFSATNMLGFPFGNKLIWHKDLDRSDVSGFYQKKLWGCLGHQRLFTPFALHQLCEKYGFRCEKIFGTAYLPFWGPLSNFLARMNVAHAHFFGVKLRKPIPSQQSA